MQMILVLILLAYDVVALTVEDCNGIIVNNIKHEEQVLKSMLRSPNQLAINYNTNNLFFSYLSVFSETGFVSAFINLKTNEFKIIKGIAAGVASAVDEQNNIVYLGGEDGTIYQLDYDTSVANQIGSTGRNICQLFFKKDLYYTTFPEQKAYIFKNHKSYRVPELIGTSVKFVAVDNNENIYFSNSSGLFVHKKVENNTYFIGYFIVNGFMRDINGQLFVSTTQSIYYINDETKTLDKLTSMDYSYGAAIEVDGSIIYASGSSIIRLVPTKVPCISDAKKKNSHIVPV